MLRTYFILALASLSLGLAACGDDQSFFLNESPPEDTFNGRPGTSSGEGTIEGEIGAAKVDQSQETDTYVYSGYDYTDIEVWVTNDDGTQVMVRVSLPHVDSLKPGDLLGGYGSSDDGYVDSIGCSGKDPSFWDFDEWATETEGEVEEGATEGTIRVIVDATFPSGQHVHVEVELS